MVIPKTDLKETQKEIKKEKVKLEIEEKDTDLLYEKPHEKFLYKILKYNPIDYINNILRSIFNKFTIQDEVDQFQWWIAYGIWCKAATRLFWNYRAEGPIAPEHGGAVIVSNHNSGIGMLMRNSIFSRGDFSGNP